MRTRTGPENTLLAAANKRLAYKVEIQDEVAAWQDYTALSGIDWVMGISGSDGIDDPIQTLTVELRRDHGGLSLAPFRGDSALNTGGAAIDVGRGIRVSTAYATYGTAPAGGDYRMVHVGTIDSLDFSQPNIVVQSRMTVGSLLVDNWVREETEYGTVGGRRLDLVIGDIIAAWSAGITLDVPVTPAFLVTAYMQQVESVWDAIRTLAGLIGWDIRILWNSTAGEFRPTLIEPDRAKTVPDYTFAPAFIYNVQQLSIDRTWIRNVIRVTYLDIDGAPQFVEVSDATSIARFGEQWAEIIRGDGSPINTSGEATDLADAALADLAWPMADQVVEVPYNWAIELGDLERFSANGIHYNSNQDLAATGHRWEIRPKSARSHITVRGKPAGFYLNWLNSGPLGAGDPVAAWLEAGPTIEEDQGAAEATFGVIIRDPFNVRTRLLVKHRAGGDPWPLIWDEFPTTQPADKDVEWLWTVDMIEGHASQIMFGVESELPDSDPADLPIFTLTSPAFDMGLIANITGVQITFGEDGEATISASADYDTMDNAVDVGIIFNVAEDTDPATPTEATHDGEIIGPSGTAGSGVIIAAGSYAHVLAVAISKDGDPGPVKGPFKARNPLAPGPAGQIITNFLVWRANTTVTDPVNMKATYAVAGDTGWYIDLEQYDTYAEGLPVLVLDDDTTLTRTAYAFTAAPYLQAAKNAGDLSVDMIYTLIVYDGDDVERARANYSVTLTDVDEPL